LSVRTKPEGEQMKFKDDMECGEIWRKTERGGARSKKTLEKSDSSK